MRDSFCTYIISHQRPDRVDTLKYLKGSGYTGDVRIVVDDQDPTLEEYRDRYGERLVVFSKDEYEERVDLADNLEGQQTALYVREFLWDLAEEEGLEYFFVLDDDYNWFAHRIGANGAYLPSSKEVENMDDILEAMMRYMDDAPIHNLAFSQGGDWIGGSRSTNAGIKVKRKAMNAHLLKTDRRFSYLGRLNADVNTYTRHGTLGKLFMTYMPLQLNQPSTQQNPGGLTESYLEFGTYIKSFYTVMYAPACTKITMMGEEHLRPHHQISWDNAVPKVLSPEHRKASE